MFAAKNHWVDFKYFFANNLIFRNYIVNKFLIFDPKFLLVIKALVLSDIDESIDLILGKIKQDQVIIGLNQLLGVLQLRREEIDLLVLNVV